MAKIKHLQQIHDLKSYRNACRVVKQLSPYINETFYEREKVIYLNRDGRELIGSNKEVIKSKVMIHSLLRNEVYIHYDCPLDWQNEYSLEVQLKPRSNLEIHLGGSLKMSDKLKVVPDAMFKRNGYLYFIEVDNTRKMIDNKKKIDRYAEILPLIRKDFKESPIVCFFTMSEDRRRKFQELLKGRSIRHEVKTFEEIK